MNERKPTADLPSAIEKFRWILKSQYHAALAMLRQAIDLCPESLWFDAHHANSFWQIAYHTLFFAHLYVQRNETAFRPWEHHQTNVQYPDGIPGPPDPNSELQLLPDPYTKAEVLEYWYFCDLMIDDAVDALDILSPQSGFTRYAVAKLEHQLINIRHIQHGAAQLADRLRAETGTSIEWVKAWSG